MKKFLLFTLLCFLSVNAQTVTDYAVGLNSPIGIVFDNTGNLYVAEKNTYSISKISPSLVKTTFASNLDGAPNQMLINPLTNDLWVAGDGFFSRVIQITQAGVKTENTATGDPYGIAVDASGNIFYSEYTNGNIKKRTPSGVVTTFVSNLFNPAGMTFDANGNLIVALPNDSKVIKIDVNGNVSDLISSIPGARFVTYNSNGDLYISTGFLNKIYIFNNGATDGSQTVFVSNLGAYGLAIYNNNLYASTASGNKIVKITLPVLGLDDVFYNQNDFFVYPNPTSEYLFIENLSDEVKFIAIYDVMGNKIKEYSSQEINDRKLYLPTLGTGVYVLKINNFSKKISIR